MNGLLHNYTRVEVDPVSSPVEVIRQSLYYVDKVNKTRLLAHLIETMNIPAALVFSRTKHGANRVAQDLNKVGISAAAIHGNKSQTARVQALNDFKAGRIRVLVATDIAARGIDIEELGCVFNYNLPDVPETYVHRIGRTGRAGHDGIAISFCQFDEKDELKSIQKLLGKNIPVVEGHPFPMENFELPQKDKNGRPVNAEDAEARAAAKERRRQRDAENKAKAEARKQVQPEAARKQAEQEQKKAEPKPVPAAEQADAPAKKKRKRKHKKPAEQAASVQEPVKAPAEEPSPKEEYSRERPQNWGVRQGRLLDTLPEDPVMPCADFHKPNPLDSDVIMDATARLLAPRRPVMPPVQPVTEPKKEKTAPKQKQEQPKQKKKKTKKKKPQTPQPQVQKTEAPKQNQGKEQSKKTAQPQNSAPKRNNNQKKKSKKNDRPHSAEPSHRSDRQKDSTQQKSLMKPYYISHEE